MKSLKCLLFCLILLACNYSQYVWSQPAKYDGQPETGTSETVFIPGGYLKAAMTAAEDFQRYLNKEFNGDSRPISSHLRNINNYATTIKREDKGQKYTVHFGPGLFQGGPVKGGGATYFIDSKSFKILKEERSR